MAGITVKPCPPSECGAAKSFLQSPFWGNFKEKFNWRPHYFTIDYDACCGAFTIPLLVLVRKIARVFSLAYIPWGPEIPETCLKESGSLTMIMTDIARGLSAHIPCAALLRFDLPWYSENAPLLLGAPAPLNAPAALNAPFQKAPVNVQAPDTVIIDLLPDEEEILARMKPKWRYNVKLGCKKTLVEQSGIEGLPEFYKLMEETAKRDRIFIHAQSYYRALFEAADAGLDLRLYLARFEGLAIAGIVTLFRGGEAVYLYGASSNAYRNLMAPYALQWAVIRGAKEAGCASYDLFGIPPDDNPAHPMAGLYRFKTGFGGKIVHRPGCYDYAVRPLAAGAFRTAERVRKMILKKAR